MSRPISTRCAAAAALVAAALLALAPPARAEPPHGGNPPGNNGTVKVDGEPFDSHPDNEPHPGCAFEIDFYGYDAVDLEGGEVDASVTFEAIAPTPGGSTTEDLVISDPPDGEDPAGGGTDLDASRTFDISSILAGVEPHDQQGHHVKLTVHAEGSQGADVKHKVFWVEECETLATEETAPDQQVEQQEQVQQPETAVLADEATRQLTGEAGDQPAEAAPAQVAGVQIEAAPRVAAGELARTGGPTERLLVLAGAALAAGSALVSASDRRRRRATI